jgi:death-on-curing protein
VKATPDHCFHLTVDIVKEIHAEALSNFGGGSGIRENSLLESAVAAPQVTIRGRPPFVDLEEVGAAYLFYLCKNHPFVDGNKRTALGAGLVFLRLNGVQVVPDSDEWAKLTFAVADSSLDREETTRWLRRLVKSPAAPKPRKPRK